MHTLVLATRASGLGHAVTTRTRVTTTTSEGRLRLKNPWTSEGDEIGPSKGPVQDHAPAQYALHPPGTSRLCG